MLLARNYMPTIFCSLNFLLRFSKQQQPAKKKSLKYLVYFMKFFHNEINKNKINGWTNAFLRFLELKRTSASSDYESLLVASDAGRCDMSWGKG